MATTNEAAGILSALGKLKIPGVALAIIATIVAVGWAAPRLPFNNVKPQISALDVRVTKVESIVTGLGRLACLQATKEQAALSGLPCKELIR